MSSHHKYFVWFSNLDSQKFMFMCVRQRKCDLDGIIWAWVCIWCVCCAKYCITAVSWWVAGEVETADPSRVTLARMRGHRNTHHKTWALGLPAAVWLCVCVYVCVSYTHSLVYLSMYVWAGIPLSHVHVWRCAWPLSCFMSVRWSADLGMVRPTYKGACNMQHLKL